MKNKLLLMAMGIAFTTQIITAQVPSFVPTNGLIAYYPFNGNANDESGNNHNGVVNGATLTADRFGNLNSSYNFTGTTNEITLNNSQTLINGSFSVSAWCTIETLSPSNYDAVIIGQYNGQVANERKWLFGYRSVSTQRGISYYLCDNFGNAASNSSTLNWVAQASTWYHITWVFTSGNSIKTYINGVLHSEVSTALSNFNNVANTVLTKIGNGIDIDIPARLPWSGKIDDVGIWNRALTQNEITNLYNAKNVTICESIGQDSSLLYSNGYVTGPENKILNQGVHIDSKWISVTGSESLNITTYQHRLYDKSRIYDQNDKLIWEWAGESAPATTWYSKDHSVNVAGNDKVRIEFYQGYPAFCFGYLKVTKMTCSNLIVKSNEINNLINIYPNPANDHITIDSGNLSNVSGWVIKISNILGQEIFTGAMNTQLYVVPFNAWGGQGVYFVKIYDASNNILDTKKIILQ